MLPAFSRQFIFERGVIFGIPQLYVQSVPSELPPDLHAKWASVELVKSHVSGQGIDRVLVVLVPNDGFGFGKKIDRKSVV